MLLGMMACVAENGEGFFPAPSLLVHNKRRLSSSLALLIKYISRADFEFVRISLLRGVSERQIKAV
jgi:hypothetical protein